MFRRRRGMSLSKIIGLVLFIIGLIIFLYILPIKIWAFVFALMCMAIGILVYHF